MKCKSGKDFGNHLGSKPLFHEGENWGSCWLSELQKVINPLTAELTLNPSFLTLALVLSCYIMLPLKIKF